MKNYSQISRYYLLVLIVFFLGTSACGGEDPLTIAEEKFLLLEGDWVLGTIEVDGVDQSANYDGLQLSFAQTQLTVSGGGSLFRSGMWEWGTPEAQEILLSDGKELRIVSLTASSLVFTFTYSQGGAAYGIDGAYRVSLVK